MTPELMSLLVVAAGVLVVLGLAYGASKLKGSDVLGGDTLSMICDVVVLVSSVGLSNTEAKNIAKSVVSVIEFVQVSMANAPKEAQKEKAVEMLKDLSTVSKIKDLSDSDIAKIVDIAFIIMNK